MASLMKWLHGIGTRVKNAFDTVTRKLAGCCGSKWSKLSLTDRLLHVYMDDANSCMAFNEPKRSRLERKNAATPFLKLPPELRNQIYHLALPKPKSFCVALLSTYGHHLPRVGLLQTCQALRTEGVPIFYRDQKIGLLFDDQSYTRSFLWLNDQTDIAIASMRYIGVTKCTFCPCYKELDFHVRIDRDDKKQPIRVSVSPRHGKTGCCRGTKGFCRRARDSLQGWNLGAESSSFSRRKLNRLLEIMSSFKDFDVEIEKWAWTPRTGFSRV